MKHASQKKLHSAIEAGLNIGSGFFLSLVVWIYIVVPWWNLKVTSADNLNITLLFTVISIVRSYVWRRVFNRIHVRWAKADAARENA